MTEQCVVAEMDRNHYIACWFDFVSPCQLRNGLAALILGCQRLVPGINPSLNLYCVFCCATVAAEAILALARSDAEPPDEPGP